MTAIRGELLANDRDQLQNHPLDESKLHYTVSHCIWKRFDAAYGAHFHLFYELLIHKRNGAVMNVGPNNYEMTPYSMFVIAPYQLHHVVCSEPLYDYERICIQVSEEQLLQCGMDLLPMRDMLNSGQVQYTLLPEEYNELERLADGFRRQTMQDVVDPFDAVEDIALLMRMLSLVCRAIVRQKPRGDSTGMKPLVRQVVSYIGKHSMENLTLQSVAQIFNVNKYYLSHIFTEETGISVYQYMLVCRVDAAKKMIISGESITNTAYRCGFNDYSGFLRAFMKIVGKSPSEFRKGIIGK